MYRVSATLTKLLLNFYETLHSCSTLPTDVHEGMVDVQNLKGEIIQLILSRKGGGGGGGGWGHVPCKRNSY